MSDQAIPSPADSSLSALAATLNDAVSAPHAGNNGAELSRRVALARKHIAGKLVFTTSFGIEDQAIAHAVFSQQLPVDVVTLDTGRLFPETRDVWAETERRYGIRVAAFAPETREVEALLAEQGADGFRDSVTNRQACCGVRKVAPLGRALEGASAWITGLRGDQSAQRSHTPFAEVDTARKLIKINPLFDWTREGVVAFVDAEHIPYNALHDRGFLSIGCAPCTRALKPGESERAGRWWWEQEDKKECGLHFSASPSGETVVARRAPEQTIPEHVS
jgi:phosphoadenosine phosphosulfate reductase